MAGASAFLALPLCVHVDKRGVSTLLQGQLDAFHQQITDFTPLVEGDLPFVASICDVGDSGTNAQFTG
jgi:hypothetical protein